jgi:hypothetical protein
MFDHKFKNIPKLNIKKMSLKEVANRVEEAEDMIESIHYHNERMLLKKIEKDRKKMKGF